MRPGEGQCYPRYQPNWLQGQVIWLKDGRWPHFLSLPHATNLTDEQQRIKHWRLTNMWNHEFNDLLFPFDLWHLNFWLKLCRGGGWGIGTRRQRHHLGTTSKRCDRRATRRTDWKSLLDGWTGLSVGCWRPDSSPPPTDFDLASSIRKLKGWTSQWPLPMAGQQCPMEIPKFRVLLHVN